MGTLDDLNSTGKNIVTNLSQLVQAFNNAFPTITGTFTLANATNTVVTQTKITANSKVFLTATNSSAAITQRTIGIFHSANTPGASFTVSTQNASASGLETFEYFATST